MPVSDRDLADTGIDGLDDVTGGGLARGRVFLLEGSPGAGKTTLALQFLMAGAAQGEKVLYITLSETEDELRASALVDPFDIRAEARGAGVVLPARHSRAERGSRTGVGPWTAEDAEG